MSEVPVDDMRSAAGIPEQDAAPRKKWNKPEAAVLPVEETAHQGNPGNDGNGSSSGS